jgi:aromatic ring-opening dioxygenase catalytic subunit (LigB family)
MYPKADIPVVQLSLNEKFTEQQHFELVQALRS